MTIRRAVALGFLALSAAGPLAAQERARACRMELDSAGVQRSIERGPGVHHLFWSGGVYAHCRGQATTIRADSVAWYADIERVDMVGKVAFQDSLVHLDAARASYFMADERFEAFGDVKLVNRRTRTTLTGPQLSYYRRAGVRDTSELYATQRPRVDYRAERDSAGAEPYVIVADRIRFRGNNVAWAGGAVTVDRSDFATRSDSAFLDLDGGTGELIGHGEVKGRSGSGYELRGRTVEYRMVERQLTWVQARELAEATSTDWRLASDTIEFDLADRKIQGGRAWGKTRKPQASSTTYILLADSLALDAPGQRLRQVRGYREARATSLADTTRGQPDWMSGDTLVAQFDSTAASASTLSRMTATGNARAYYQVADPARPGPSGITYSRGKRIVARFTPVGLERVDVTGAGDGVYLEPAAAVAGPTS